ncbi:synaptosomal-associated protein 29 [Armigeres subalbatus]|uniref:synaptosomal-associated protein 29 n=1 Tax=Armigeres subalbatus TaxID=124917 RepID=UPI002ED3E9C2
MSGHQYVPNPTKLFEEDEDVDDQLFLRNARRPGSSNASPSADHQGYKFDQFQKKFLSQNYDSVVEGEKYCPMNAGQVRGDNSGTNYARPDVLGPEPFGASGGGYNYGANSAGGYVSDTFGTSASVSTSPYNSKHYRQGHASAVYSDLDSDVDDEIIKQRQTFESRRRELEESTLLTSQRCLGVLRETEQVGIATAEELHRQREQLEKTKKQLDEINNSLRFSQKHLNSLKSVFGGLKNYLSGRMNQDQQQNITTGISQTNISPSPSEEVYPNPQDFRIPDSYWPDAVNLRPNYHQKQDMAQTNGSPMAAGGFSQQLDQNLDDMRGNLSRLKHLALDLNQEIDSQNDLIDDISNRVDDVDVKIGKQNKEMNRLMRK